MLSRWKIAECFLLPVLHRLDPERAHDLAVAALRAGLPSGARARQPSSLQTEVFGLRFPSPVGLAAGFDKNAEVVEPLFRLEFGFVEVGTLTPQPQRGNPKPRLFRLPGEQALANRMGLNNCGFEEAGRRLRSIKNRSGVVGVSLGSNTDSSDKIADYVEGVDRFRETADYLVLNLSCPNTADGRSLQEIAALEQLLRRVSDRRVGKTPLLIKIAPDISARQEQAIAGFAANGLVDGLVVSNTQPVERGGLSGRPLFAPSTRQLSRMYAMTHGRVPLVGVGGVFTAEDAYAKIRAGASLVQIYTALVYGGAGVVGRIHAGLARLLERDGYAHVRDAVGKDACEKSQAVA
ncbi:MAG: quinone-dependent dihydroorotate dehydrogenase [Hyphomicrobiales bacterium]|nr:quinone-dependent dihydroorotate dehydrogenase [Hyphomicrobiales bacterium]